MEKQTSVKDKWTKEYALAWAEEQLDLDVLPATFKFRLNPNLMDNKDFINEYAELWSGHVGFYCLSAVSERLRDDPDFVVNYFQRSPADESNFKFISERLKNDRDFALQMVSECRRVNDLFPLLKDEFKNDPEIILGVLSWENEDSLNPETELKKSVAKLVDMKQYVGKPLGEVFEDLIGTFEKKVAESAIVTPVPAKRATRRKP